MFSGIITGAFPVTRIEDKEHGISLFIELDEAHLEGLAPGASVSVNGTCLTVTQIAEKEVKFDIIPETLGITNLSSIREGEKVNIERSLRVGDEIGGHILSGHVDGTAQITALVQNQMGYQLWIAPPAHLLKFILAKGFIAVEGASLTVQEVKNNIIKLALIPETLHRTTLKTKKEGDKLNVEIDRTTQAIVTAVENYMSHIRRDE